LSCHGHKLHQLLMVDVDQYIIICLKFSANHHMNICILSCCPVSGSNGCPDSVMILDSTTETFKTVTSILHPPLLLLELLLPINECQHFLHFGLNTCKVQIFMHQFGYITDNRNTPPCSAHIGHIGHHLNFSVW
jgi:hypothetical protein